MNIYLSSAFKSAYKRLVKKNKPLQRKIKTKIQTFKDKPNHPSLKLHKLTGSLHDTWSFSVESDLRILFCYIEDGVLFTNIGKHEDVY